MLGHLLPGGPGVRLPPPVRAVGAAGLAAGLGVATVAALELGAELTPAVVPRPGSSLRTGGLYALSRNPLYAGLLVASGGAVLLRGRLTTVAAAAEPRDRAARQGTGRGAGAGRPLRRGLRDLPGDGAAPARGPPRLTGPPPRGCGATAAAGGPAVPGGSRVLGSAGGGDVQARDALGEDGLHVALGQRVRRPDHTRACRRRRPCGPPPSARSAGGRWLGRARGRSGRPRLSPRCSAVSTLVVTRSTMSRTKPPGTEPSCRALSAALTAPQESCPRTTSSGTPRTTVANSTEPRTAVSSACPAVRTTNRSPRPRSNTSSAATRESEHPSRAANGDWPVLTSRRWSASALGRRASSAANRSFPARSSAQASAGVVGVIARAPVPAAGASRSASHGGSAPGRGARDGGDARRVGQHRADGPGVDGAQGRPAGRPQQAVPGQAVQQAGHERVAGTDRVDHLRRRAVHVHRAPRGQAVRAALAARDDDHGGAPHEPGPGDVERVDPRPQPGEVLVADLDHVGDADVGRAPWPGRRPGRP